MLLGGGIVGSTIARAIKRKDLGDVLLIEKETKLGLHASGRNSGVIHSGINQKPGTLKAKMCVKGSKMLRDYCKDNNVPFHECGTLVVSRNEREDTILQEVYKLGVDAGVEGLRIIYDKELGEREPLVRGSKALLSPSGAVVDSISLLDKIFEDLSHLGIESHFNSELKHIGGRVAMTNHEDIRFSHLVNCAGLYADKIAKMAGLNTDLKVIPFRGDYFKANLKINSMVYQVPDLRFPFLGVHLTKSLDNGSLIGPSSSLSWKGRESYNGEFSFSEFSDTIFSQNFFKLMANRELLTLAYHNASLSLSKTSFLNEINSFLEEPIQANSVSKYRSGIRAQMVDASGKMVNEFIVERGKNSTHILNAVSPGMTSSLAFAEYVVDNYVPKVHK